MFVQKSSKNKYTGDYQNNDFILIPTLGTTIKKQPEYMNISVPIKTSP